MYEYAQNQSQVFTNARNHTTFTYPANWYPTGYRGYRLHAEVINLQQTVNPVENGDFEKYPEVGNEWSLSHPGNPLISSASRTSGGNPGYCLDAAIYSGFSFSARESRLENTFEYYSSVVPDTPHVSFDIRFSADIPKATWFDISVVLYDGFGNPKGLWVDTTANFHPTIWTQISFPTPFINGSMTLRVSMSTPSWKTLGGHIYFDNFEYLIGSDVTPTDVGLTLNGTSVVDTSGNNGEIDLYADPAQKEQLDLTNGWNTTQVFCFNSTMGISFDFQFTMYIKSENQDAAQSWFSVELNDSPSWVVNYSILSERPPTGHVGYQFGLHLQSGWTLSAVRNQIGNLFTTYTYNSTSQFFFFDEDVASPGDTFSLHIVSENYIPEILFQKGSSSSGPWTNVSVGDYFVIGDYLRVIASLVASGSDNTCNISLLLPNGSICQSDLSPVLDSVTDTYTSAAWMIEPLCEEYAGQPCSALVAYNSSFQCGFREEIFTVMNLARGTLNYPSQDAILDWSGVNVNVTWQNLMTDNYITNGRAVLRYTDAFGQVQFAEMTPNGCGSYSLRISTLDYEASYLLSFDVEFYRSGYVNATYASGTTLQFSVTVNTGIPPTFLGIPTNLIFLSFFTIFLITATTISYRTYRRRIIIPRQLAREKTLQKVLDMYNDVTNLSRILVLQRSSGIPIFDPLEGSGIDASIFGGFLSAIQAFAIDVANGAKDEDLESNTRLSEISYEGFRIIINDGSLIRTALVYKGVPSETLKEGVNQFTRRFEERYQTELQEYGNQPGRFAAATDLVEEIFHVSLLFPHSVEPKATDIPLTVQESRLHYVALELTKDREFVYLLEIVNKYLETVQENPVELLSSILKLREKKLLIPSDFFRQTNSNNH